VEIFIIISITSGKNTNYSFVLRFNYGILFSCAKFNEKDFPQGMA